MNTESDERLLRLAERLADGESLDWDELQRGDPDLAESFARFRELQALSSAYRSAAREEAKAMDEPTVPWSREPLFLWGEIEVLEEIGEGGFAKVYRAWDPSLESEVALKLSREDEPTTAIRIQRWFDEARRLAKVRHSNVVVIHGVDVRDGRAGFWTELIRGRNLEQILADDGPFGGAEAVLIGLDLCRALAAVHAAGLVHGDLKAKNVMREGSASADPRSGSGRIVLMDFGASSESSPPLSRSATFATPLVAAPEVLRGDPPSPRSDIYSLGVLLFRLLTHRHPVETTDEDVLNAKVQQGIRDSLRDQRSDLGAPLVAVVEKALASDPAHRFASAGEMERALSEVLTQVPDPRPIPSPRNVILRRVLIVAGAMAIAVAGEEIWRWLRPPAPPTNVPIHFTVGAPARKLLRTDPNNFAVSPDGQTLAFVAFDSTGQSLWVRGMGDYKAREIPNTRGAAFPFWSPDGRQIGFFSQAKMRRVRVAGGDPETICDAPSPHGGTWNRRGDIVFSPGNGSLYRVSASGGDPESVTTADRKAGASAHAWPTFLPDDEHFIYVARRIEPFLNDDPPRPGPWTSYVGSIRSRHSEPLLSANSAAMYAEPHHVIFIRNDVLLTQNFDLRALRVKGDPAPITDSPAPLSILGSKCGSVSVNGVLAWQSRGSFKSRLVWIDRQARRGRELAVVPERWFHPIISPDGSRAVLRRDEEDGGSLWLIDLERESLSRLASGSNTLDPGTWSPDGREILYSVRGPGGVCEVRRMAVDRPESDRLLYRSVAALQNAYGWTPDGRWALVQEMRKGSDFDLTLVPAEGGAPRPWLATPAGERRAEISPDGKWVLYLTTESGPPQACVRSFSDPSRKYLVSPVPLFYARWSREGREILLFGRDFRLRSVKVSSKGDLQLGTPQELFSVASDVRGLAATPDGERFLMLEPEEKTASEPSIQVNANWMAGLRP